MSEHVILAPIGATWRSGKKVTIGAVLRAIRPYTSNPEFYRGAVERLYDEHTLDDQADRFLDAVRSQVLDAIARSQP